MDRRPRESGPERPRTRGGQANRAPQRSAGGQEIGGEPERERGPQREAHEHPDLPEDLPIDELDRSVKMELAGLHGGLANEVSRRLVMAGRLLDTDPETAYLHAAAAREKAARVPSVREAVGLAAYRTGRWSEALAELRTVRRLTGSHEHLPIMADCERGLGRPERALAAAGTPEAQQLDLAGRVELLIVAAGARHDLGEDDAAVLALQIPELRSTARTPWLARLRSAYADALAQVGRVDEARHWLELAAEADEDGSTAAAERLAELDGFEFVDLDDDEVDVRESDEVDVRDHDEAEGLEGDGDGDEDGDEIEDDVPEGGEDGDPRGAAGTASPVVRTIPPTTGLAPAFVSVELPAEAEDDEDDDDELDDDEDGVDG